MQKKFEEQYKEKALMCVELGLSVFPLQIGSKEPHPNTHGCKDASNDPDVVSRMWDTYPNSNIAVATGLPSKTWVLDVDVKNGAKGLETLAQLEKEYGSLPTTRMCITATEGRLYHFAYNGAVTIKNTVGLGRSDSGIDVRGEGGYVVAPPSYRNIAGEIRQYRWVEGTLSILAEAPQWLIELVKESEKPYRANVIKGDVIQKGVRNDTLFRMASSMRRNGASEEEIYHFLRSTNERRVRPMLSDHEVRKIAVNVASRYDSEAPLRTVNLADEELSTEDAAVSIPSMPEDVMYGWVGKRAKQLDCALGYSYPALITTSAALIRHCQMDENIRTQTYCALLGPVGQGKTFTMERAIEAVQLIPDFIHPTTFSSDRGVYKEFEDDKFSDEPQLVWCDELWNMMQKMQMPLSSLPQTLTTLWNHNEAKGVDKNGTVGCKVYPHLLGGLKVKDASDFRRAFGNKTSDGLADRFIYGWAEHRDFVPHDIPCDNRYPEKPVVPKQVWQTANEWANEQTETRKRLKEIALRVAFVTASMNHDPEITKEGMAAAIRFCEWQETIRKVMIPSESITLKER